MLLLLKPVQFPFPWFLLSVFPLPPPPVSVEDSEKNLMAPSVGIRMAKKIGIVCERQCDAQALLL